MLPEQLMLLDQFPRQLDLGHRVLACDYAFEPGTEVDGVTVTIPVETTGDLPRQQLDWLVPGLLPEKITALIKGLPKTYRVKLVPVADTVQAILREMPRGNESLPTALSRFLFQRLKVDIPAAAWPVDGLPDHLKMRLAITDARGRVVASGREDSLLDQNVSESSRPKGMQALTRRWERQGITVWDFGDLPEAVSGDDKRGGQWRFYPRLETDGSGIRIRLFVDLKTAEAAHVNGVVALLTRHFADDLKFLKKSLKLPVLLKRQTVNFGGMAAVEAQLFQCITRELFAHPILTEVDYKARLNELTGIRLHQCGQDLRDRVIAVIEAHHDAQCRIADVERKCIASPVVGQFLQTLKNELTRLVPDNFVLLYNRKRLSHLVRYLSALSIRAQRGYTDLEKDRSRQTLLVPFVDHLNRMLQSLDSSTSSEKRAAVEAFFWMIEEYKVSIFAQEVGTDGPVSVKRLDHLIGEINRII
jgi:ATP-dependent helicase HrpA